MNEPMLTDFFVAFGYAHIFVCSLMMWIYEGRQVTDGVVVVLSNCPNPCITEQHATFKNPMELR